MGKIIKLFPSEQEKLETKNNISKLKILINKHIVKNKKQAITKIKNEQTKN